MAMKVVAKGIYQTSNGGYRVVARLGDRRTEVSREKRFPKGTKLKAMKDWQGNTLAELRRQDFRPARGTLAADAPRYLDVMKARLQEPEHREKELSAWYQRFGDRRRDSIKQEEIRQQMLDWEANGSRLAPSSIASPHSRSFI